MPTKRMLIDAAHPEEIRVAIVEDDRLLDHDVEVASRRQLKGNIYLAKVTRVEPSLQAAFVDYGGNRHGFLAFSEIHPDYYQIPVADRERLIAEQQAIDADDRNGDEERSEDGSVVDDDEIEVRRPRLSSRHYKIQEVIKRRQIMLVQVAKEERGTKGAALTTYLSLAGRYCVLMPNTTRGGGISRKITNGPDRKRLKKIVSELDIPEGVAVILRTAGAERSKAEIKRDYEYLMRLWSTIRELTLSSMAPALVYEEGSLIKRSIRDMYDRAIEEILIEGDVAYRTAKDFMKLFIPSHAKRVKLYEDERWPLFQRYNVETELEAMHSMTVELRSGGSIVINPTEALVSIDVNSGRATRERHIEETALRTNLEACDEISRQLRLRDLAGLIVIDFIDMEVSRNQAQVERRLREAMKGDRARVQFGRISTFGLLELSRQRLRRSMWETSYEVCQACSGTGVRRSTESAALSILRRIEAEALRDGIARLTVSASAPVALYLLNQKRRTLLRLEERYDIEIAVVAAHESAATVFDVEARLIEDEPVERAAIPDVSKADAEAEATSDDREDGSKRSRRRRPRRRKRQDDETVAEAELKSGTDGPDAAPEVAEDADSEAMPAEEASAGSAEAGEDDGGDSTGTARKRRRRGKRGGRRRAARSGEEATDVEAVDGDEEPPRDGVGELPAPGTLLAAPLDLDQAEPSSDADERVDLETVVYVSSSAEAEIVERKTEEADAGSSVDESRGETEHVDELPADAENERETISSREPQDDAAEPLVAEAVEEEVVARRDLDDVEAESEVDDRAPAAAAMQAGADPEASRTVVINVGEDDGVDGDNRRRGWWQRFLS